LPPDRLAELDLPAPNAVGDKGALKVYGTGENPGLTGIAFRRDLLLCRVRPAARCNQKKLPNLPKLRR
jgi:hypothetical protein